MIGVDKEEEIETEELEIDFGILMMVIINASLVGGALYSIIVDHIM